MRRSHRFLAPFKRWDLIVEHLLELPLINHLQWIFLLLEILEALVYMSIVRCWWKFLEWCPLTNQQVTSDGMATVCLLPTSAWPLLPLTWAWWRRRWRRPSTQPRLSSGQTCRQWWLLARMGWMWVTQWRKQPCTLWPWQNSTCSCMGWAREEIRWPRTMEEPGAEVVPQGGEEVGGGEQHKWDCPSFPSLLAWGPPLVFWDSKSKSEIYISHPLKSAFFSELRSHS